LTDFDLFLTVFDIYLISVFTFPTQPDSTEFPDSKTGVESTNPNLADQEKLQETTIPMNLLPFQANNLQEKSLSLLAVLILTSLTGTTVTQPTKEKPTVNFNAERNLSDEKTRKFMFSKPHF